MDSMRWMLVRGEGGTLYRVEVRGCSYTFLPVMAPHPDYTHELQLEVDPAPPPTPEELVPPNYSPPSPSRSNWLLSNQWRDEREEGSLPSLPSLPSSPLGEEGEFSWTEEEELPTAAESLHVISRQLDRLLALLYSEVEKSQEHQTINEATILEELRKVHTAHLSRRRSLSCPPRPETRTESSPGSPDFSNMRRRALARERAVKGLLYTQRYLNMTFSG